MSTFNTRQNRREAVNDDTTRVGVGSEYDVLCVPRPIIVWLRAAAFRVPRSAYCVLPSLLSFVSSYVPVFLFVHLLWTANFER
jgi:hypothetical protein